MKRQLKALNSKFLPIILLIAMILGTYNFVEQLENNEHVATIKIDYTVTEGVFQDTDFVIIQL